MVADGTAHAVGLHGDYDGIARTQHPELGARHRCRIDEVKPAVLAPHEQLGVSDLLDPAPKLACSLPLSPGGTDTCEQQHDPDRLPQHGAEVVQDCGRRPSGGALSISAHPGRQSGEGSRSIGDGEGP